MMGMRKEIRRKRVIRKRGRPDPKLVIFLADVTDLTCQEKCRKRGMTQQE